MPGAKIASDGGMRAIAGVLAAGMLLVFAAVSTAAAADKVGFGVPPWPGERVKAEIATQILNAMGYEASATDASWVISLQAVAKGDLSADMALWRPTQNSVLDPMLKSGKVVLLTTNIKDAKYDIVVPDYVWEGGVHSIADLHKYGDRFDHKIYGIEAGNDGNELVKDAIKNNLYDLSGWQLMPSSTAGMLAQVGRAVKAHQWIAFLGWQPHWMNVVYNIRFLKDPKKMWGGASTVNTVANPDFVKSNPNVSRFLKQMDIPSKVQSQWIYDYGYKHEPIEQVASQWIESNYELVGQWLDGVKTADGSRPALDAVKEAMGSS